MRTRISVSELADGDHPLPSGGVLEVKSGFVARLLSPYFEDREHRQRIEEDTVREVSELSGIEVFSGFWKVTAPMCIAAWPQELSRT